MILQEELGYACAPSPFISNAFAGALIEAAGSDEQKAALAAGHRLGRGPRRRRARPRRRSRSSAPPQGAAVLVLDDGERARSWSSPATPTLERLDLIDTTRAYFRVAADGGEPLPGDVDRRRRRRRGRARRRARRRRPAGARAWRSTTPRSASSSTARSAPTRRSPTASPTCSGTSRRRARSPTTRPGCADAEPESLPLAASMAKARASDSADLGHPQRDPDLRRHRLHLGARHPLPAQAGAGQRPAARHLAPAPRARRLARRPRLVPRAVGGEERAHARRRRSGRARPATGSRASPSSIARLTGADITSQLKWAAASSGSSSSSAPRRRGARTPRPGPRPCGAGRARRTLRPSSGKRPGLADHEPPQLHQLRLHHRRRAGAGRGRAGRPRGRRRRRAPATSPSTGSPAASTALVTISANRRSLSAKCL